MKRRAGVLELIVVCSDECADLVSFTDEELSSFVGDLSLADRRVLHDLALESERIVEFGAGASTALFCATRDRRLAAGLPCKVVTIETDAGWIARTTENLALYGVLESPLFLTTWRLAHLHIQSPDLVFNDGIDDLRLDFARYAWRDMKVGGTMAFHDTRREGDVRQALAFFGEVVAEVGAIAVNVNASYGADRSNLTLAAKAAPLGYVNWNEVEGKAAWQVGHEPIPEAEKEKLRAFWASRRP